MNAAVAPAERSLRLLHVEDSEPDHALVVAELRRAGLAVTVERVERLADVAAALDAHAAGRRWDAVLSDFGLPGFDGLGVLELMRERRVYAPLLLVSGQIGEDRAVAAMRVGAADYVLKGRLQRLAPALLHAIEAAEARNERQRSEAELRQSRQALHELAGHLQTSIERERASIAREIHDDVGGSLTALKFDLAWIERHADTADVRDRARAALETVSLAIEASQRVMHNLRPAILEQGLVAAVQWLAAGFERRTGVACLVRASHEQMDLPPGVPLVAFRTAQEALTNVAKHAEASQVDIDLSIDSGVLTLEVKDNGRGLTPADLAKAQSFGIRGLHERAATVGGWVDLSSAQGLSLILSVPLVADAAGGIDGLEGLDA